MAKTPTDIRSLARSHTETAITTLASIMNQANCPPAARIAAADVLLSRGWGKPKEHVEITANACDGLSDADLASILAVVRAKDRAGDEVGAGVGATTH